MTCPQCQRETSPGAAFCDECGARLESRCPACGETNRPGAKFCRACGQSLLRDAVAPEPRPTPPPATVPPFEGLQSPRSYTPSHLADKILTSRSALEGERKQVTVLFADVVESTRLAGRLDAEAMHEVMDQVLRLMAQVVHRHDGTVNQFLGDGLMALFGAPLALEDHALRAAEAAFALQETIAGLSAELEKERGVQVRLRIGLNTGLVVVGRIGDDLRMDYTAVGDTTHLAARMQGLAAPGTILVAEATHRLVAGYVRSEAVGPLEVKGLTEPVLAYRLLSRRSRTRLEVRSEQGLTPLIGRARELEILRDRLERARAGHDQVVGIVGEAGVGKSRLVHEFRASLQGESVVVLEGACPAHAAPYAPIAEVLRGAFRIEGGDDVSRIEEKLRQGVMALDPALAEALPPLRALVGLSPDETTAKLDPKARRQRIFETVRAILMAASREQPHVILIEDLERIDEASEDYLTFLADSLGGMRVLLVTTQRPGHSARWAARAYFTQLGLDALDEAGTAAVLAACLGAGELPAGLAHLVHDKVEGNPLFIEEVARSLLERGILVRTADAVGWAGAQVVDVPAAGQDIIRARIDTLPDPAKRTLQAAAVIGRRFAARLLARVVERPADLDAHLETLRRAELIQESRFFPEAEYAFKHALVQEVAYDTLLARRRRDLHGAIGRALEDLSPDRLAEQYEVLAHHFSAAAQRDKAVEYLVKAGDRAAAVFANIEAAARFERALGFLDDSEAALHAHLLHRIAELSYYHRDPETTWRYSQSALELHERLGDRQRAMAMHLNLAAVYMGGWQDGAREDRALEHLEAAAAIAHDEPDSPAKGLILQRTAHLHLHRGAPATALAWAQRAVDLFARIQMPAGTSLGTAWSYLGRIDDGVAYNQSNWDAVVKGGNPLVISVLGHELTLTLALARDAGRAREAGERALGDLLRLPEPSRPAAFEAQIRRPLLLGLTLAGMPAKAGEECRFIEGLWEKTWFGCFWEDAACVGLHYFRQGDWDTARRVSERTMAVMTERNQAAAISACSYVLGCLDLAEGRHPEAEAHLSRSLGICRTGGNVLFELWVLPLLCELYVETGRLGPAEGCLERGLALLEPGRNWYGLPAGMSQARGMLARQRRDWGQAEAAFEAAVAVNRAHHLAWDEAKSLLEWGRTLVARDAPGDREAARARFGAALTVWERIGSRRHAAEAHRLMEGAG